MSAPPPLPPVPADGDVKGGKTLNIIIWLFTAITTLVFAGRIYSRKFITRNIGWDDAILGLSMALLYIQCAFVSVSVQYGLGRHQYYLLISNPQDVSMVVKWQLYSQPIGILGTTIPKIAVTMLLIKLLGLSSLSKTFLWSANIVLNAISIVCIAISFAQCTPTSTYWTRVGGNCWNPTIVANFAITQGALSAFTDFCLAIYPIVVIKDLQMPLQRKIAVCILMGFGSLAGVAAIIRTSKLAKLAQQRDFTWSIWTLVLWVAIECCVIIVCACMPSIRPLFRKFYENSVGSTFPSIFSKRKSGMGFKSYSAGFSPEGSMQETKISAASSDDGSDISLKKSGGIRSTTDVEIRHSLRHNQV